MKLRTIFVCILSLFLLALSIPNHAMVEVPVFEGTFERGTGAPYPDVRTFDVLPELSGEVILRAYNGAIDGAYDYEKVSSTAMSLNGVDILGPESFNQNVDFIEKTVELVAGENTFECILKSKPGGTLQVKMFKVIDADAAEVVTSDGEVINTFDNKLSLEIPTQALSSEELIIVNEILDSQYQRIYDINPDGLSFMEPVQITIDYDPTLLSSGINETEQYLAILDDSLEVIDILVDSVVDTTNHKINATSTHFSNFAITTPANNSSAIPPAASEFLKFKIPVNNANLTRPYRHETDVSFGTGYHVDFRIILTQNF
jgi:hypothetical protein